MVTQHRKEGWQSRHDTFAREEIGLSTNRGKFYAKNCQKDLTRARVPSEIAALDDLEGTELSALRL